MIGASNSANGMDRPCFRDAPFGMGADNRIQMPDAIEAVEADDAIVVRLKSGATLEVDTVLAATGRTGNTQGLGIEDQGVELGQRGTVKVNEHYQTNVPHIYAAGDIIGFPALASTAMEQARVAMVHAFDLSYKTMLAHILP